MSGFGGLSTQVDLTVNLKSSYDIGFHQTKDGSYDIIADWYGVNGVREEDFIRDLKQNYSLEVIKLEMKKKGYQIAEQSKLKDKSIKIIIRQW